MSVLCRACRRRVGRAEPSCTACGAPRAGGAEAPLELVPAGGAPVPVGDAISLGRAPDSGLVIADRTVSRRHARVVRREGRTWLEDAGSAHGTLLDGRPIRPAPAPLRDGSVIGLGDVDILVRRRRPHGAAARTLMVAAGAVAGPSGDREPAAGPAPPKVRPGWALKRLEAGEGALRYVLRDVRTDRHLRMGAEEASLLDLLDGTRSAGGLLREAQRRLGPDDGAAALATLLASLAEHGLLEGAAPAAPPAPARGARARLIRLARPHDRELRGAGRALERLYARGGWTLFTPGALALAAALALAGAAAFAAAAAGGGSPFVVASSAGIGGLVFLAGRILAVTLHELAHGLTLICLGRPVRRAGLRAVLLVPFAFVDTSAAHFEPRRRRLAVTAAGPASDLVLGGALSIASLLLAGGTAGEVCFQLALASYVGAVLNLNPLLDRDGYQMLADALGQPALRARSRARLARALAGRPAPSGEPGGLPAYILASLAWALAAPALALALWRDHLAAAAALVPEPVAWAAAGLLALVCLLPALLIVAPPLSERRRQRAPAPGG